MESGLFWLGSRLWSSLERVLKIFASSIGLLMEGITLQGTKSYYFTTDHDFIILVTVSVGKLP